MLQNPKKIKFAIFFFENFLKNLEKIPIFYKVTIFILTLLVYLYIIYYKIDAAHTSVGGVMVSIDAFQALDPGSIPGHRKLFLLSEEQLLRIYDSFLIYPNLIGYVNRSSFAFFSQKLERMRITTVLTILLVRISWGIFSIFLVCF